MFEYAFGRIIAEELGYKFSHNLTASEITNYFHLPNNIGGKEFNSPVQEIEAIYKWDKSLLTDILNNKEDRKIVLHGFFQKYSYYINYKEKIKKWFYFDFNKYSFEDAIGVHIRKTDFGAPVHRHFDLPDEYFLDVLKTENYESIHITSDDPNHCLIKKIQNEFNNVLVFSGNAVETMERFVCYKKILISQGTFSWWMAFLSNAEKIYMPQKLVEPGEIDLRVIDESRYVFV